MMTTTTQTAHTEPHTTQVVPTPRTGSGGLGWWLSDASEMALRNVRHIWRSPELLAFAVIQPVMFILLFQFVFGGAISVPGGDYAQFLLPGIFVQMVLFSSVSAVAIGLAEDMQKGIVDRFRSMPVHRAAVLAGRTASEIGRNVLMVLVMVVVGLLVGWRIQGTVGMALAGFALLLLAGFAFSWLAALIGLTAPTAEAAQSANAMWLFPFTLISSMVVPVASMPGWLQAYAAYSPMTALVDTLRAWFTGAPAGSSAWIAFAWCAGILLVCGPLAVRLYRRRSA